MVGYHLRDHWDPDLHAHCYGVFCQVLAVEMGVMRFLSGSVFSHLVAVRSTGGILESACSYVLDGTVNSAFKVGVGGSSGSAGNASKRIIGSSRISARSAHSLGRFGTGSSVGFWLGFFCHNVWRFLVE